MTESLNWALRLRGGAVWAAEVWLDTDPSTAVYLARRFPKAAEVTAHKNPKTGGGRMQAVCDLTPNDKNRGGSATGLEKLRTLLRTAKKMGFAVRYSPGSKDVPSEKDAMAAIEAAEKRNKQR